MAQTTFEKRLDTILLLQNVGKKYRPVAIAEIKQLILQELPQEIEPEFQDGEIHAAAIMYNQAIKEITEKIK